MNKKMSVYKGLSIEKLYCRIYNSERCKIMKEKIVGILGGMGPEATCEMFRRIIKLTGAKSDSEHLRIIIDNNPKIPDRTKAILHNGHSPVEEMVSTAKNLVGAGADFIIIPCMTAHRFISEVQSFVNVPILDAIELTKQYIEEKYKNVNRIGLLATSGTVYAGLFQKYLVENKIIVPNSALQDEVMDIIYGNNGIKFGNTSQEIVDRLKKVVLELTEAEGVEAIIAGCTEVGFVLKQSDIDLPLIDPLTVLASESVKLAKINS